MPDTPTTPSQIILVALDNLRDPDWNPRPFLDEAEMPSLVDYVAAGRPIPPIEILKAPHQAGPWDVISGKRRCEAHRRAGRTHIEAIIRDVPLEEAKFMAIAANKDNKPFWLGEFIAVNNLKKGIYGEQKEMALKLGWTEYRVSCAFNLMNLLNQAARDLILQFSGLRISVSNSSGHQNTKNTGKKKPWIFTEWVATSLIPLWDENNRELSQFRAEQTVRAVIDGQLTGSQTDALVIHTLAGNDPARFEPAAKVRKTRTPKTGSSQVPTHTSPIADGHQPLAQPKPAPRLETSVQVSPEMAGKMVELPIPAAHHPQPTHHAATAAPAQTTPEPDKPSWFWQWMVGIKFFGQLRSKVKKGENLTNTEKLIVIAYRVYKFAEPPFKDFGKFIGKTLKEMVKSIWHSVKKACGKTFAKIMEWAIPILIICALFWSAGKVYQYVIVNPLHWLEGKVNSGFHWGGNAQEAPAPVSTPPPVASTNLSKVEAAVAHLVPKKKTEKSPPTSAPVIAYQPSAAFNTSASGSSPVMTLYDPKLLEQEIAALPQNCIVTAYPVLPDEGIPGDLAVTRLQDVMDPDKYTLMIGGGKYKIMNISATATGLMINYQNTDIIDVFNHGGTATYVWEDMLYIHTDEIEQVRSSELGSSQLKTSNSSLLTSSPDNVIYHCTLIGAGAKNALTFRCNSADGLKHLVSALEYFIRNSRLRRDTALAGMPYPSRGLVFNNQCVVEKLWADSPAANAVSSMETAQPNPVASHSGSSQLEASQQTGLQLGDHLWSIGKATKDPQERKVFEKSLSSLPVTLFVASDSDWNKALIAKDSGMAPTFRPKLRKVLMN